MLAVLLLSISANAHAGWYKEERAIMGTEIAVDLWHEDESIAAHCGALVFEEMQRINELMSPYLPESELARINAEASDKPVKISEELFGLIKESLKYSEISDGAFDITYASVGYMYDYRKRQRPNDLIIDQTVEKINYRHIQLNEQQHTIQFATKGVRIDLGGIAKGYAIDTSVAILKRCGIKNGYVSAGGDSRIIGDRNGRPWVLGIKHPRQSDKVVVKLPLTNIAVSTSGDYERFFIENGTRYHHIIRPQTGRSVTETWSTTVIGENATMTDALSTTLFVLDAKSALVLIDKMPGVDAIIIDAKGEMHYSSGLMPPEPAIEKH
ncbi:MAG TPA: FAD:protein FMN transferase [Gammaproteobacteria bacterium]